MAPGSQRTRFSDPTLIRLLAPLASTTPVAPSAPGPAQRDLAERLSRWLHWTDTGELCAALDLAPPPTTATPTPPGAGGHAEREFADLRQQLAEAMADAIAEDCALPPANPPSPTRPDHARVPDLPTDFAPYRRRCARRQQAMEHAIAGLRARVRDALARRSPDLARLAAVDAVMERSLSTHERLLLSMVPVLLQGQFDRLQATATAGDQGPGARGPGRQDAWLVSFCRSMKAVMLAELALRLQPVDALVAALRSPTAGTDSATPTP